MANERLRTALLERGITPADLAEAAGVDPKTVERWISGRMPYRRHRYPVAARLGSTRPISGPTRWPRQVASRRRARSWLFTRTAGPFRAMPGGPIRLGRTRDRRPRLQRPLPCRRYRHAHVASRKADEGVSIRILLGDPDFPMSTPAGEDEGIDDALAAKIRNVLVLYRPLRETEGVEFRLHSTVLYNSIYRADGQLLVNPHIYGRPAAQAPVLHLRQIAGGTWSRTYLESFERVWSGARPLD